MQQIYQEAFIAGYARKAMNTKRTHWSLNLLSPMNI